MNYSDGVKVHLGDRVLISGSMHGNVVCSLDTGEFSAAYPEQEWAYLRAGVLVLTDEAGLIHLTDDGDLVFVSR